MFKKRDVLHISLFLGIVLILWSSLSVLPGPAYIRQPFMDWGSHDLTGANFEDTVYSLNQSWVAWPDALYFPHELADAGTPVPYDSLDHKTLHYATYRVLLKLRPGVTYGIALRSSDYAMRLFVDGAKIVSAGSPAATKEENIPRVREVEFYFTPQRDTVELVVHSSNHVHYRGGADAPVLTVGTAESISHYMRNDNLKTGVVFGLLMAASLYHFSIYLLNRRQRASLVFAALCLLMSLVCRDFPSLLFPEYNWQLAKRIEYIIYILAGAALMILAETLFTKTVHKQVFWGYLLLCGAYILMIFMADSVLFTRVLLIFHIISVGVIVYGLSRMALRLRERQQKNTLAFVGITLFGICIICDILIRNNLMGFLNPPTGQLVDATTGIVLMVLCFIMVLSIDQAEVNVRLEEAAIALAEAETRYQELSEAGRESRIEEASVRRLSDFNLTKRETDVALLLLDGKSREEIAGLLCVSMGTVNTHCTNLYRKTECRSVAELLRLMLPGQAMSIQ